MHDSRSYLIVEAQESRKEKLILGMKSNLTKFEIVNLSSVLSVSRAAMHCTLAILSAWFLILTFYF